METGYNVSPAVVEVLRRTGFPLDTLEEQGFPHLAALVRRAIEEAGEEAVGDPLQPVERASEHPAPREAPALRVVR
jgi:hypothetical protein